MTSEMRGGFNTPGMLSDGGKPELARRPDRRETHDEVVQEVERHREVERAGRPDEDVAAEREDGEEDRARGTRADVAGDERRGADGDHDPPREGHLATER